MNNRTRDTANMSYEQLPDCLSLLEFAQYVGIGKTHAWSLVDQGLIRSKRSGAGKGARIIIRKEWILAWLEGEPTPAQVDDAGARLVGAPVLRAVREVRR